MYHDVLWVVRCYYVCVVRMCVVLFVGEKSRFGVTVRWYEGNYRVVGEKSRSYVMVY